MKKKVNRINRKKKALKKNLLSETVIARSTISSHSSFWSWSQSGSLIRIPALPSSAWHCPRTCSQRQYSSLIWNFLAIQSTLCSRAYFSCRASDYFFSHERFGYKSICSVEAHIKLRPCRVHIHKMWGLSSYILHFFIINIFHFIVDVIYEMS